ncbi:Uncharacterized protein PRO82_001245 [Candidatus Protochlamydia amoebophila]|nr:Uncharacterized protein [Candidatus Protochlamydia amoebophila]
MVVSIKIEYTEKIFNTNLRFKFKYSKRQATKVVILINKDENSCFKKIHLRRFC